MQSKITCELCNGEISADGWRRLRREKHHFSMPMLGRDRYVTRRAGQSGREKVKLASVRQQHFCSGELVYRSLCINSTSTRFFDITGKLVEAVQYDDGYGIDSPKKAVQTNDAGVVSEPQR